MQRYFELILCNAFGEFGVYNLDIIFHTLEVFQITQNLLDLQLLLLSDIRRRVPPRYILLRYFRSSGCHGLYFDGLAAAEGLDHQPQLMNFFIKIVLVDFISLELIDLQLQVFDCRLVPIEQFVAHVDLLLLL